MAFIRTGKRRGGQVSEAQRVKTATGLQSHSLEKKPTETIRRQPNTLSGGLEAGESLRVQYKSPKASPHRTVSSPVDIRRFQSKEDAAHQPDPTAMRQAESAVPRFSRHPRIATIQRFLTEKNLGDFYVLKQVKKGIDNVYLGTLKGSPSKALPKHIVFKKGGGAGLDRDANLQLMGVPGIYKVVGQGSDYLIREAYEDDDTYSSWKDLTKYGETLLQQTTLLALKLLEKGIIDTDRELHPTVAGEMTLKNMVITGKKVGKPTVHFFDFEPRCQIEWKKVSYEDKDSYQLWLWAYSKILQNLAKNVKESPTAASQKLGLLSQEILKHFGADQVFVEPEKEERPAYEPPILILSKTSKFESNSQASVGGAKKKVPEKIPAHYNKKGISLKAYERITGHKSSLKLPDTVHWIPELKSKLACEEYVRITDGIW